MVVGELLFRFKVDGRVVGAVLADGAVVWEDLEVLSAFARQHLTPSRLGPNTGIETTVGVDIDLISLPSSPGSGSQASAKIVFAVEERTRVLSR